MHHISVVGRCAAVKSPVTIYRQVSNSAILRSSTSTSSPTETPSVSSDYYDKLSPRQRQMVERIIRVDHAGELGADRIYAGQMAVLGSTSVGNLIQHMWDQEKHHLRTFEKLIPANRVRPTALSPLWFCAGWMLGASTALVSKEAAMACTVAVEETITDHYNDQIRELMEDDPELHKDLLKTITQFRNEEMEHHDTGLDQNAEQAPFFQALKSAIQFGCKRAIWLSERI